MNSTGIWFPEFCYEVTARRSGDYASVTLITTGPDHPRAHIEQFRTADLHACRTEVQGWLTIVAMRHAASDDRILDWAATVAAMLEDALTNVDARAEPSAA